MNKKIIIPIILLVAILITAFIIIKNNSLQENTPTQTDTNQTSIELDPYIPDMDSDEIKNTIEKPATDSQKEVIDAAINKIALPEDTMVGEDGNLYAPAESTGQDQLNQQLNQQPIEHPHQDIIDMTDEEAEEDYQRRLQELKDRINSNTTTDIPDVTGTPNDSNSSPNNAPSSTEPSGSVWDQAFYDTLTDIQKEDYKKFNDEDRVKMQQAVELTREWEKEGYISSNGQYLTPEEIEESWSNIGTP